MLKRNLLANYLGQCWTAGISLAVVPIYIHHLGIEAYGIIGIYSMMQTCLVLLDIGMAPTLGREMARFTGGGYSIEGLRDLLRSIEIAAVTIAITIAVIVGLGADWAANAWVHFETLSKKVTSQSFAIMGTVLALRFIESIYRSAIIGLQQQIVLNVASSILSAVRHLGGVVIVVWVSTSISSFFIWQAVSSFISLMVLSVITYRGIPLGTRSGQFSIIALRSVRHFAGGMVAISFLSILLTQTDKIILSKILTMSEYGYYSLAVAASGMLTTLIAPIAQAYYPRICGMCAQDDQYGVVDCFHKCAQLVSVIVGSAAIVLANFSELFLLIWTQDSLLAEHVHPLLSLLAIGGGLNAIMWVPFQTQLAYGWTSLSTYINLIAVLGLVPALFWFVPRYGPNAAAWTWVILNVINVLIGAQFMFLRILKMEKTKWYLFDIFLPLFAAMVSVCVIKSIFPVPKGVVERIILLVAASVFALTASSVMVKFVRIQLCQFGAKMFRGERKK